MVTQYNDAYAGFSCLAAIEAPATTAIVVNKVLTDPQGSLDFVTSMFPGTTPTMNWAGVYGATTGTISIILTEKL